MPDLRRLLPRRGHPEMQVKQYVADLVGAFGTVWQVYRTGDDRYYLLVCAANPLITRPTLKAELRPEVRQALAHGYGHPHPTGETTP